MHSGDRGPSSLRIHTFGGLRVLLDDAPVEGFGARSAEALLVYLACHAQPVPRAVLAELLWPERPAQASQANLRVALHRLRQQLDSRHLEITRTSVGLTPAVWTDAAAFETLLREQRREPALEIYRGEFLQAFHLDESPLFEGWLALEQERLRHLALAAAQELLSEAVRLDQPGAAVRHARRLLELDQLHEPAHRVLMRLMARQGNRAAALDQFESCRSRLEREMGVEPDPATTSLAESIRRGAAAREAPDEAPATVRHDNLPAPGYFVGREDEIARICNRLASPDCRLLTITGPGGVGKTRVAIEAARQCAEMFENGVLFVPLAGVRSAQYILPAVSQALELRHPPDGDAQDHLLSYLRGKRMLVLCDNLEHLAGGSGALLALMRHAPGVKLLVTSRERLRLSEEWLLPMAGLPREGAAAALFDHHATRTDPAFDASGREGDIQEICSLVEGLPLALELAASWIGVMTCEAIARRIRKDALFLSAARADAPERHQSLRRVLDHSWDLLTPDLQGVLMRLSVFSGGFLPEVARDVAGASLEQLRDLAESSLLRSSVRGRLELHELVRQYSADRLARAGEVEDTSRRHFETYLALAVAERPRLFGSALLESLQKLEDEHANLRAALDWALASGFDADRTAELTAAVARFLIVGRTAAEARGWLERTLRLDGLTPARSAELLYFLGYVAWIRMDLDEAEERLAASLDICRSLGEAGRLTRALARGVLGMTRFRRDDPAEALGIFDSNLPELEALGEAWWAAHHYGWRAWALAALGDPVAAESAVAECLGRYRDMGDPFGRGLFLGFAATLRLQGGDPDGARQLAEEARDLLGHIGFKYALGGVLRILQTVATVQGRHEEAGEHARRIVSLSQELGNEGSPHARHHTLLAPEPAPGRK